LTDDESVIGHRFAVNARARNAVDAMRIYRRFLPFYPRINKVKLTFI